MQEMLLIRFLFICNLSVVCFPPSRDCSQPGMKIHSPHRLKSSRGKADKRSKSGISNSIRSPSCFIVFSLGASRLEVSNEILAFLWLLQSSEHHLGSLHRPTRGDENEVRLESQQKTTQKNLDGRKHKSVATPIIVLGVRGRTDVVTITATWS